MRMNRNEPLDAYAVVNGYGEKELADVIWKFGEERKSRRIARAIVWNREHEPIATTADLAKIVSGAAGGKFRTKTLARVFQAIRIEVNRELENLRKVLEDGIHAFAARRASGCDLISLARRPDCQTDIQSCGRGKKRSPVSLESDAASSGTGGDSGYKKTGHRIGGRNSEKSAGAQCKNARN